MDNETYEQVSGPREMIGEPADFLRDGMICTVKLYEGAPLSVDLPQSVTSWQVVEADPVVRARPRRPRTSPASSRTAAAS